MTGKWTATVLSVEITPPAIIFKINNLQDYSGRTSQLRHPRALLWRARLRESFFGTEAVVGWATRHIAMLRSGQTVSFRPTGRSLERRIKSGQLCTVAPVDPATLDVGDIVLCKVSGNEYLHIVKAIDGARFQIGNNRGCING